MTTNAMPSVPIMSALRAIHVETERDHEIRAQLQRLLQVDADGNLTPIPVRFTASRETRGIVLVEPAGGGRTTATAEVLRSIDVLGINPATGAPQVLQGSVAQIWRCGDFPFPRTDLSHGFCDGRTEGCVAVGHGHSDLELCDLTIEAPGREALAQQRDAIHPGFYATSSRIPAPSPPDGPAEVA